DFTERPLHSFPTRRSSDLDPELMRIMEQVYTPENEPRTWPPDWTSGGFSMAENVAIDRGLARFLSDAQRSLQSGTDAFPVLTSRSEEHTSELQSRENLVCR